MRQYFLDSSESEDDFPIDFASIELSKTRGVDVDNDWNCFIHDTAETLWAKIFKNFSAQESEIVQDTTISISQVIKNLNKYYSTLAKEKKCQKIIDNYREGWFAIYLEDGSSIAINIDLLDQSFWVVAPVNYKNFKPSEWKLGLAWLQESIKYSPEWEVRKKTLVKNFYLNFKGALISINSIKTFVKSFFYKKGLNYKMIQFYFESEIIFETSNHLFYYIKIYNKPFTQTPKLLISFLNNPHEEEITDKLICRIIKGPKKKLKKAFERGIYSIKEAGKIGD